MHTHNKRKILLWTSPPPEKATVEYEAGQRSGWMWPAWGRGHEENNFRARLWEIDKKLTFPAPLLYLSGHTCSDPGPQDHPPPPPPYAHQTCSLLSCDYPSYYPGDPRNLGLILIPPNPIASLLDIKIQSGIEWNPLHVITSLKNFILIRSQSPEVVIKQYLWRPVLLLYS